MQGKKNITAGFLFPAAFMGYGFILTYLRDSAPGLRLDGDGERS